jgi:hypothetical protein
MVADESLAALAFSMSLPFMHGKHCQKNVAVEPRHCDSCVTSPRDLPYPEPPIGCRHLGRGKVNDLCGFHLS